MSNISRRCNRLTIYLLLLILYFCLTIAFYIYSAYVLNHLSQFCVELLRGFIFTAIALLIIYSILIQQWLVYYQIVKSNNSNSNNNSTITDNSHIRSPLLNSSLNNNHSNNSNEEQLAYEYGFVGDNTIITTVSNNNNTSSNSTNISNSTHSKYYNYSIKSLWILFYFFVVLLFLLITGIFSFLLYLQIHTLPQLTGTLNYSGLIGEVTVDRDIDGLIHITAQNNHDLYYSQGIIHAQQRLFQMEFQRRIGAGTLSSIVGNNKRTIQIDKFARVMNFYKSANSALSSIGTESLSYLQAYTDGINAYLQQNRPLSIEMIVLGMNELDPWTLTDSLVWSKLMAYTLCLNMDKELYRYDLLTKQNLTKARISELMPEYQYQRFPFVIPEEDGNYQPQESTTDNTVEEPLIEWFNNNPDQYSIHSNPLLSYHRTFSQYYRSVFGPNKASNNWVVHGSRTKSGKPLLNNDPHLQLMSPNIWILMHLKSPSMNVIGSSFPGIPAIILGHNDAISWGVTNVGADVQDLYLMQDLLNNQNQYIYKNEIMNYTVNTEIINIKGSDPIIFTYRSCIYGPVITDIDINVRTESNINLRSASLALRWTSLDPIDTTVDAIMQLNRALNFTEFRAALSLYISPSQNFIYADTAGNIGYQLPGKIPIRVDGHSGLYPVPGNGDYDWIRFIPYNELPTVFNPKSGYIASANNRVTNLTYPYSIARDWDSGSEGYRALRIVNMIESSTTHTVESMRAIQGDYLSLMCIDFQSVIQKLNSNKLSPLGQYWQRQLLEWDCIMSIGSLSATVFNKWYLQLARLPAAEIQQSYHDDPIYLLRVFNSTQIQFDHNCPSVADGGCLAYAESAFDRVSNGIINQWGIDIKQASFEHQLLGSTPLACMANRAVNHGGDGFTVNVGSPDYSTANMIDNSGCINNNLDMWPIDNNYQYSQTHGSAFRQIIDLSALDSNSIFMIGLGQSGSQLSQWYDNLLIRWGNTEYLSMSRNQYSTEHKLTLRP